MYDQTFTILREQYNKCNSTSSRHSILLKLLNSGKVLFFEKQHKLTLRQILSEGGT
jgi:hypothetical protein